MAKKKVVKKAKIVNARMIRQKKKSSSQKGGGIGYFGKIKFYIRYKNGRPDVLSFNNFSWKSSINFENHKRQKKKPLIEIVDRNGDEITMDIYLSAYLGQSPMKKWKVLRKYCLYYKTYPLVLGGQRVGSHKFIISELSNTPTTINRNGKMVAIKVSVTFAEYIEGKKTSKKKKTVKGKAKKKKKTKNSKYTVKKGDTLWKIAKKVYGNGAKYKKIYNANKTASKEYHKLTSPSQKLKAGWVLKIPK